MNKRRQKLDISVLLDYIISICIVFNFNIIWNSLVGKDWIEDVIIVAFGIAVAFRIAVEKNISRRNINSAILFEILILIYIVLFGFLNSNNIIPLVKLAGIIVFVSALVIIEGIDYLNKKLLPTLEKFIILIAAISIFFWLFGTQLHIIPYTSIEYSTWSSNIILQKVTNYYNIYYETQSINFGDIWIRRNSSIFTEGAMCSFIFTIALLIEKFISSRKNVAKEMIIVVALITTFTTTAVIVLILVYGFAIAAFLNKKTKFMVVPVLFAIACILLHGIMADKMMTISGNSRLNDIIGGIKAWLHKPILGYGYRTLVIHYGYSNSFIKILIYGGIYMIVPYIMAVCKAVRIGFRKRRKQYIYFIIIYLFVFFVVVSPFNIINILVFVYLAYNNFLDCNQRGKGIIHD
ncbi:MAG: hypothetical protein J6O73_02685 [Lachnospiraceae bacterium]|nr:hypothetical protein [Lachnospiraceae bacterium]